MQDSIFEEGVCSLLCKQYKVHIEKACFANGFIPNYILLDSTRNIHSYLEFCKMNDGMLSSSHWDGHSIEGLVQLLRTQYSQLDRPLFFIFQADNGEYRIIESSPIREYLLEGGNGSISQFMIDNSDELKDTILKISKEL